MPGPWMRDLAGNIARFRTPRSRCSLPEYPPSTGANIEPSVISPCSVRVGNIKAKISRSMP